MLINLKIDSSSSTNYLYKDIASLLLNELKQSINTIIHLKSEITQYIQEVLSLKETLSENELKLAKSRSQKSVLKFRHATRLSTIQKEMIVSPKETNNPARDPEMSKQINLNHELNAQIQQLMKEKTKLKEELCDYAESILEKNAKLRAYQDKQLLYSRREKQIVKLKKAGEGVDSHLKRVKGVVSSLKKDLVTLNQANQEVSKV